MASRKKRICSQPLRVMSELLRFQHREHEVTERENADEQSDSGVDAHVSPHFMSRSHRATYPMLTAKKRIVSATKMKSDTLILPSLRQLTNLTTQRKSPTRK